MILELDYPCAELMPNRKNGKHWASTKNVKDICFNRAFYFTKQALNGKKYRDDKIALVITFIQSDKRHRDLDNMLAASKAAIDGIAKAIGVDDKNFEPITIKRGYNKLQSATIVELIQ